MEALIKPPCIKPPCTKPDCIKAGCTTPDCCMKLGCMRPVINLVSGCGIIVSARVSYIHLPLSIIFVPGFKLANPGGACTTLLDCGTLSVESVFSIIKYLCK